MNETSFQLQQVNQVVSVERTEKTSDLAQSLEVAGVCDGTLVLACEQLHTFSSGSKWISSGEGGIYFSLIMHSCPYPQEALEAMSHAILDTLRAGLSGRMRSTKNSVEIWDQAAISWKRIADLSTHILASGGTLLSVGLMLNNKPPRCASRRYSFVKKLTGCEISKELFLEDILESFWKYMSWK